MKIALVVPGLTQGGGVPAVARFVRDTALRDGRFEVKVVSLSMDSRDPDSVRFRSPASVLRGARARRGAWDGMPYVQAGCWGAELEFQRYRPRRALSEELRDCDLIQVVAGAPAWANAVLGLGKPVSLQVATRARVERRMRDAGGHGLAGLWRKAMTAVTDRLDDRALRGVDAVQVENPWMLDYARRVAAGRRVDIRYAPPGVDAEVFSPAGPRDLSGTRSILCVGRLDDPRKNIGLLLEAFARLPRALRASAELWLAGSTAPAPAFWERAEALGVRGRVKHAASPSREELVSLYRRAGVFALPSDEEGLGVVLLEAMACAVPVVSTRSGGPDGIITDGVDGFLTPLNDAGAMAGRLAFLLESPRANLEMGARARRAIEARYASPVAGREFIAAWEALLRMPAGPESGPLP